MHRFLVVAFVGAWIGISSLLAQTSSPVNDNPLAGLDTGESQKPSASGEAPSDFLAKFNHHLVVLNHDNTTPADPATLNGVKYVAFYYSASWCPPCRAFTPKLVDFYGYFKKSHPNFELIFVDNDADEPAMLNYMKMDSMPWPAVEHGDLDSPSLNAKKYQGPGIPCLVLVDDTGKVLADSWVNGQYVGPDTVVEAIKRMVPTP